MSRLDEILNARNGKVNTELTKQEIKTLMLEMYNKALQTYFIDKITEDLDEAFEKAVESL